MLTATQVEKAKPAAKPRRFYDERGLYLEVRGTSQAKAAKWWRLKYRFDGREKLLSLGTYPDTSLADARVARDKARELIAAGTDPSEARKADKAARAVALVNTVEAVARAWLEATVQRLPEFVDPTDKPTATPASIANQTFGRRFELVSFRWLKPEEI